MNRRELLQPISIASLLAAAGCNLDDSSDKEEAPKGVVLAFGDSITRGHSVAESYGRKIERLTGREVVRSGVDGENAVDGQKRLPGVLAQVKPAVLILLEGTNDSWRNLPVANTAAAIENMVALARARGVRTVLVGTVPPLLGPRASFQPNVTALNRRIRGGSGTVVEVHDRLGPGDMNPDGIHPNDSGHTKIAQAFAARL